MNKKRLLEYCKEHNIFVPKDAKLEYLHAAICRAFNHKKEVKAKDCFGYWSDELANCIICAHCGECFQASLGVSKEKYDKELVTLEVANLEKH